MALHEYWRSLVASPDAKLKLLLDSVYRELFPDCAVERIVYDASADFQRGGRDLRIQLRAPRGGKHDESVFETIEEKIRTPKNSQYHDLLVEYLSCQERGTLGWVYTSKADWLAYVRQPLGRLDVLILPMSQLHDWFVPRMAKYRDKSAKTRLSDGTIYTTVNKVVPLADPDFQSFWKANGCRQFTRKVEEPDYEELPF